MQTALRQIPVLLASFCCWTILFLNDYYTGPLWVPFSAAFLANYLLASVLALWAVGDAARRCRTVPYDFGSFLFFLWPVLLPVYLAKTRGWKAVIPIFIFVAIYFSAALFSEIISFGAVL